MKNDNLKRLDTQPPVISGEFVPVQSVVTVTNLAVTGPYRGDFQVIDEGRVIVGNDPDLGPRGILSARALQGYNANGLNTFAVWFATTEQHAPGDFHAGNLGGNFLAYDQAAGTLGLYTPDGAGVLMDNDGTFIAGHSDHGHLKWDAVSQSLKIMSGAAVMAEIGDDGNAQFTGIITATGGHITGRMFVDDVLQAGDSDGPAIYLGRFERTNDAGALIETSEILATNASNLPWFHVTAGGETAGDGFFTLGGQGDYAQRLTYDGTNLVFDGTVYARGGTFTGAIVAASGTIAGWTINPNNLASADGSTILNATGGIVLDALIAQYNQAGVKWMHGGIEYFRIGTELDEGSVAYEVIDARENLALRSDGVVSIRPGSGSVVTIGTASTSIVSLEATAIDMTGVASVTLNNASTAVVDPILTLAHGSSGTPAAQFGSGIAFNLKSTTTQNRPASTLNTLWASPTHGAESAAVTLNTVYNGALTNVAKFGGTLGCVLNEDGNAWNDLRVEGDTDTHLLFLDASTDRVGIGTDAPATLFHVDGVATIENGVIAPTVAYTSGTAQVFRLNADGFALGDHTPSGTDDFLHVINNWNGNTSVIIDNQNAGADAQTVIHMWSNAAGLRFATYSTAGGKYVNVIAHDDSQFNIMQAADAPLNFWTHNTTRLVITGAGDMALGDTPIDKLRDFTVKNSSANASAETQISIVTDGPAFRIKAYSLAGGGYVNIGLTGSTNGMNFIIGDNAPLGFYTHNVQRIAVSGSGDVAIGGSTNYAQFDAAGTLTLHGTAKIINTEGTPASASASGVKGEIRFDTAYLYVCVAANTWRRVFLETW